VARKLYADDSFGVDLKETVYALDTTTIDLCLSVFPWAPFRSAKAAVKLHTLLDLRGNIPVFIHISDGKMHEVNILEPEPGAFYIVDRGFLDFKRLFRFHEAGSFFVTRQGESASAASLLPSGGSRHRIDLRSDDLAHGILLAQGLPDSAAAHPFQRSEDWQAADLLDQQLCAARFDDRRSVSMPLAGGAVFQMDQAASSYQTVLWHFRERGEDTDLDRRVGIRVGGHLEKALEHLGEPLRNATDLEPDHV
jgi:hypothetical protein